MNLENYKPGSKNTYIESLVFHIQTTIRKVFFLKEDKSSINVYIVLKINSRKTLLRSIRAK